MAVFDDLKALSRTHGRRHVARLWSLLNRTLAELDEAGAAFLENIRQQEEGQTTELFEEGGRLSVVVHLRIETFYALASRLLDHLGQAIEGVPNVPTSLVAGRLRLLAEVESDRDIHVRFGDGAYTMTATVWSSSGDAGISPGDTSPDSVTLREVMDRLEDYLADVLGLLEARTSPP